MSRRTSVFSAAALTFLACASAGSLGCKSKAEAPWKLPIDAKQLPSTTSVIEAELIEGMRETDAHLKSTYTSAELGAEVCREGSSDPAHELELLGIFGHASAKHFFTPANLANVQSLLECGSVLANGLDASFQTAVHFTDDAGKKAEIDVLKLKIDEFPAKYGLTKRSFGTHEGFCRTLDPAKPTVTIECGPTSEAAIKEGSTWFLGQRGELDGVARLLSAPKSELSTQVAALNDAANEIEGLSTLRIESQLTTSKPFLSAPCAWGGFQTAGNANDFIQGCFPSSDDKIIQDIDAKLRAAAFEIEADVVKAGGVHGGIVLVARDDDGAKVIEKDANDLVTDWKSQLENNEAKLVKQAKTNAISLRQKSWAIIVDNFSRALQKTKVARSGRVVKMRFNEALADDDKRDLVEAQKETADVRGAVADILTAIEAKQPVPVAPLTKLVGAPWATYLVAESTYDPKNLPASCTAAKPAPVAKGKKAAPVAPPDPKCAAPVEPAAAEFAKK